MSSLYLGILYAMSALGSVGGFILGGFFVSLYTDFDNVDDSE